MNALKDEDKTEMKCYTVNEHRTHVMHIVDGNLLNIWYCCIKLFCQQSAAISCCMFVYARDIPFTQ